MTLSVPYSFVPGTKAKADEVNANFNAVLEKIEQTSDEINSNIDSQISELKTANEGKLNLDLSNLDTAGKAVLDAKANKTDLDGSWVLVDKRLAENITMTPTYKKSFALTGILPADNGLYEVIVCATIRSGTTLHNAIGVYASSPKTDTVYLCRCVTRVANQNQIASGNGVIPVSTNHTVEIGATGETNANSQANSCTFKISAYRKVR